jgi:hypothetical protein
MGLLSRLFGVPPRPSRDELQLLVSYSVLLETLGDKSIYDCVSDALLPADKDKLREIIAKVSLHKRETRVLYGGDLVTAYGALAFFVPEEDLLLVKKIQNSRRGVPTPTEVERGMHTFMEAHQRALVAEEELRRHADAILKFEQYKITTE